MKGLQFVLGICLAAAGCTGAETASDPIGVDPLVSHVLVVVNNASPESRAVADYYVAKRHIPKANVLHINTSTDEEVDEETYRSQILNPIRASIQGRMIDFIVLTGWTPIRLSGKMGYSVDAFLAGMDLTISPLDTLDDGMDLGDWKNPYFGSNEPFSHLKTHTYVVTRLIAYDVDQAKRLVDDSLAAQPSKGPFLLVEAANRTSGGYGQLQKTMDRASALLDAGGFQTQLDRSGTFLEPSAPVAGYCSWGSNDGKFNLDAYHRVRFLPGALAQTFVSTSARTFHRTKGGQSLIADLIEQGVTGAAGYVSEPYVFALGRPDILFDRYTHGYNLAESFAAASPIVKWKELIIGDPLCRPYAAAKN